MTCIPFFSKSYLKAVTTVFLLKKQGTLKYSKTSTNIWATFEKEFMTKTFQKSPNLVTLLVGTYYLVSTLIGLQLVSVMLTSYSYDPSLKPIESFLESKEINLLR